MKQTITIKVKTFANLREIFPAKITLSINEQNPTIKDVVTTLFEEYPTAKQRFENDFSSFIILKNGRNIVHLEKKNTRLVDGDTVSIFPPIGGGAD